MQTIELAIHMRQGPPWGFRLLDTFTGSLAVSNIRKQSPADLAGLRENDVIVAINNYSAQNLNKSNAIDVINHSNHALDLIVQRQEQRKPQLMTFLLDTNFARGHLVRPEMASRNLDISRQKEQTPPRLRPQPSSIKPADPTITPVSFDRLLHEFEVPKAKPSTTKRTFANSAFYNEANMKYPSLEEQIELARRVAKSIEAPVNQGSRGARMFELQQRRIEKYVKEGLEPAPDNLKNAATLKQESMSPPAPTPPLPIPSAQRYPIQISGISLAPSSIPPPPPVQPRSIHEYAEKMSSSPKNTHAKISPQICFDIAAALHNSGSRGGTMFAKRRAKSQNWEVGSMAAATQIPEPQQIEQSQSLSKSEHLQHHRMHATQQLPTQWPNPESLNSRERISEISVRSQLPDMTQNPALMQLPNLGSRRESSSTSSSSTQPVGKPKWRPVKFNIPQKAS